MLSKDKQRLQQTVRLISHTRVSMCSIYNQILPVFTNRKSNQAGSWGKVLVSLMDHHKLPVYTIEIFYCFVTSGKIRVEAKEMGRD